MHFLMMPQKSA